MYVQRTSSNIRKTGVLKKHMFTRTCIKRTFREKLISYTGSNTQCISISGFSMDRKT